MLRVVSVKLSVLSSTYPYRNEKFEALRLLFEAGAHLVTTAFEKPRIFSFDPRSARFELTAISPSSLNPGCISRLENILRSRSSLSWYILDSSVPKKSSVSGFARKRGRGPTMSGRQLFRLRRGFSSFHFTSSQDPVHREADSKLQ